MKKSNQSNAGSLNRFLLLLLTLQTAVGIDIVYEYDKGSPWQKLTELASEDSKDAANIRQFEIHQSL